MRWGWVVYGFEGGFRLDGFKVCGSAFVEGGSDWNKGWGGSDWNLRVDRTEG